MDPQISMATTADHNDFDAPQEHNVIHNSKLDRVMYYMLLSGNEEFDLKDITYIFSANMNPEEILRVIESDHQERFCVRTGEEGKTTVRLNANVKVGGEDTLSYVIRVAEAWKAEIYKHLQRVTSSALSVICTELPRPPILPKDLKMRDLLMSDNEQRFCVYGSVDFTEVSINKSGVLRETARSEWRNSIANTLRNAAQVGEDGLEEQLLLTIAPLPNILAEQGFKAMDLLSWDSICRFSVAGQNFDNAGVPDSYVVSLRCPHESDAKMKSFVDDWRKKIYYYLHQQDNHTADISTVGAVVARPHNLPPTMKLRQVLCNDPAHRFNVQSNSGYTTVSIQRAHSGLKTTVSQNLQNMSRGNGGHYLEPDSPSEQGWITAGTKRHQRQGANEGSLSNPWNSMYMRNKPTYTTRTGNATYSQQMGGGSPDRPINKGYNHPTSPQSNYGVKQNSPSSPSLSMKERPWDREIVRDLPEATRLKQMQSYERNKPEGVKLLGFMSAANSAVARCRENGLGNEEIKLKIRKCRGSVDELKCLFPSPRMIVDTVYTNKGFNQAYDERDMEISRSTIRTTPPDDSSFMTRESYLGSPGGLGTNISNISRLTNSPHRSSYNVSPCHSTANVYISDLASGTHTHAQTTGLSHFTGNRSYQPGPSDLAEPLCVDAKMQAFAQQIRYNNVRRDLDASSFGQMGSNFGVVYPSSEGLGRPRSALVSQDTQAFDTSLSSFSSSIRANRPPPPPFPSDISFEQRKEHSAGDMSMIDVNSGSVGVGGSGFGRLPTSFSSAFPAPSGSTSYDIYSTMTSGGSLESSLNSTPARANHCDSSSTTGSISGSGSSTVSGLESNSVLQVGSEDVSSPLRRNLFNPSHASPKSPKSLSPSIIVNPNQPIKDFFRLVFVGFPPSLVDSFISGFSENGIIIVDDLLTIGNEYEQLRSIMQYSGFKVGHINRLQSAMGHNISEPSPLDNL